MFLARTLADSPDGPEPRVAVTSEPSSGWIDVRASEHARLRRAGATRAGARRLAAALVPSSLTAALQTGEAFTDSLARTLADGSGDVAPVTAPRFAVPVDAPAYRDFMAFERHFRFGSEFRGLPVPDVLYEMPVSYFGNPFGLLGPDEELAWPHYSEHMDYELELGIIIGRGGRDVLPDTALEHVLGVTILNDFSARDIQLREMQGGLGPSKGKHFGSALGPWIATLDELPEDGVRMRA
jgi:2-keto-4-pentenoate hydratase/2-oxohepta-3-ene-1,7-dioic acid hydratase in catechol pathway